MSAPKIITFLPNSMSENEKRPFLSNPIPYPEYLCLSLLTSLVKVTAPNKELSNVGSLIVVLLVLFISQTYL